MTVAAPRAIGSLPGSVTVTGVLLPWPGGAGGRKAVDGDAVAGAPGQSRPSCSKHSAMACTTPNAGLMTICGSAGGGSATSPPSTPSEANGPLRLSRSVTNTSAAPASISVGTDASRNDACAAAPPV